MENRKEWRGRVYGGLMIFVGLKIERTSCLGVKQHIPLPNQRPKIISKAIRIKNSTNLNINRESKTDNRSYKHYVPYFKQKTSTKFMPLVLINVLLIGIFS